MMSNTDFSDFDYYESLRESLEEAVAFVRGEPNDCRVVVRAYPAPDYTAQTVIQAREKLNLPQIGLAAVLGVRPDTVEAWEEGRAIPTGAERNLLYLLERDPSLVQHLLAK